MTTSRERGVSASKIGELEFRVQRAHARCYVTCPPFIYIAFMSAPRHGSYLPRGYLPCTALQRQDRRLSGPPLLALCLISQVPCAMSWAQTACCFLSGNEPQLVGDLTLRPSRLSRTLPVSWHILSAILAISSSVIDILT